MPLADAYVEIVRGRASPTAQAWLDNALTELDGGFDDPEFAVAFAGAGRRLGAEPVTLVSPEAERFRAAALPSPEGWGLDEVARTALLRVALEHLPEPAHRSFVDELFRRGDNRERQAVLRALAVLPGPERFVGIAVEACRTNVRPVFEAIACDNPYALRHFTDHQLQPAGAEGPLHRRAAGARRGPGDASHARAGAHGGRLRAASGAPPGGPCRRTARSSSRRTRCHEALRSAHPHDVAHDRRLPGDGGGRHRRHRRAGVLARPAAHARRHASRTTSCRCSAGSAFAPASSASTHFCTMALNPKEANNPERRARRARAAAALPREGRRGRGRRDRLRRHDRRRGALLRASRSSWRGARPARAHPHAASRQEARHRAHARAGARARRSPRSAC